MPRHAASSKGLRGSSVRREAGDGDIADGAADGVDDGGDAFLPDDAEHPCQP